MAIEIFVDVGYCITIRLSYHVSIFKDMGVAANGPHLLSDIAPRAPLVKILEITSTYTMIATKYDNLGPYTVNLALTPIY